MSNIGYSDVQTTKRAANRRSKPRDAEKTLAQIMDTAETLFARHGFEGTSLRQVATGVNMSQPNFYNYFSSKEKLYESVLTRSLEPLLNIISAAVRQSLFAGKGETDNELAYEAIDAFVEQLSKNKNLPGLLYQESIGGGKALAKITKGNFDKIMSQSMTAFEEAKLQIWLPEQIPFLLIAWFNLIFGYFASANLMKSTFKVASNPLGKKELEMQREFLHIVWARLMKPVKTKGK